jgi:hypothetical protein
MGIKTIYNCDEEGCDTTAEFGSGTDLYSLTRGGWLMEPAVGGSRVYCPKHRAKYDRFNLQKEVELRYGITLRSAIRVL